jgi:dipeptidase E
MIFLTSSVASVADHLYKHFLADKGYKSVLFVDTAAEPKIGDEEGDDQWLQDDLQSLRNQGYQVDRYTVTGKTRDEIEKVVDSYDIFYMCGGDTTYLLSQLRKTDSFSLIAERVRVGKPYIGTSAGSIIAGPRLPDYFDDEMPELTDRACFNFVNFTLVPHWGSPHFRERYLNKRLEIAYRDTQDPLLILTDRQYVQVLDGGAFRIVTT